MALRLRSGAATHVGVVREMNQDAVLEGPVVFAVADGMGGHAAGEVASAVSIAVMAELPDGVTCDEVVDAVRRANDEVLSQGAPGSGREGMGSTLSGVAKVDDGGSDALVAFNVGDSRVYRLDGGGLVQISSDHSLVEEMVRNGEIDASESDHHHARHILTRALGIQPDVEVDHWRIEPRSGEALLVCSDGLTNEVPDDELESVLRTCESPQEAVDRLVAAALERGGRDNVSAVVVVVEEAARDA